ncbi:LOW QUALITY PROTEIN: phosphatidylinositol transfer protein alpha isoform [Dermochelys coriacea]|uniref:LOW QUALITY PROTEIN: phosphatidylinositol transfer protein alpha isoform n=1 Tax=Dermochelys coriacea TaxID=27794 RepID=UPI0018E8AFA1|nr:LOW QUALITY PROTEIN: phosphatidylinositol transfer protein alpha isoform [Dermochelys coriacea]
MTKAVRLRAVVTQWLLQKRSPPPARSGPEAPVTFSARRSGRRSCGGGAAMVLIKEYRVILPVSVEEYQVGQLYSVAEASKNETGGGEGVEVLMNEPYERDGERGQYTHKIYHLQSKVPSFVRMLAPEGALNIHEKAWNAYPYCRTVITNEYMKDDFLIKIETWHKPDLGMQENVHKLEPDVWKNVEAVYIDIGDRNQVLSKDYKQEEDPAKFKSVKTGRGPLGSNWKKELGKQTDCPYMCAYKLVTVKFKWWGLQNKVENFIQKQEKRLFTNFHRQLFCWLDKWVDLTMEDIRRMEEETKKQLDEMREKDPVKGMTAADD